MDELIDEFVHAALIGFFLFIFLGMIGVVLAGANYYFNWWL